MSVTQAVPQAFVAIHLLAMILHHNMLRIKTPSLVTKTHCHVRLAQQQPIHRVNPMPQTHSHPVQSDSVVALIVVQLKLSILLSSNSDGPAALGADAWVIQVKRKGISVDKVAKAGLDVELGYIEQKDGGGGCMAGVGIFVVADGKFKL